MASTADNVYEFYQPSKILALVVCVLFAVLTIVHLWNIVRYRKWFCLTLVLGGLFETAGLAARIYSTDHLRDQGSYGTQTLLILLAPIFFSAAIYMFLGRIIRASDHPDLSIIRISWLSKFFVTGDVFLVNANDTADENSGENVVLAGLALQVVILVVFLLCAGTFHARLARRGLIGAINPNLLLVIMLSELYACAILILFRNVFRLVDFGLGDDGYLQAHEWPIYVLDILFMAIVMALSLNWYAADLTADHNPYRQQPMSGTA
ncbi:Protein RTM1 [Fusarium oxysporum f. sp. cubense race 1]|uniref:Protein RTM1 n=1 Tax=Fusarium oxysporum f. sp. cubense (strain race 1) TaxID=1229664 RepID=N4UL26_FUSC1|nr:Protein RTM1 [Fusarium oxysporum f. sp. cubense race 1]